MKLLTIARQDHPDFEPFFEDVEKVSIQEAAPEVMGGREDVRIGDNSIEEYDAVFADIPVKNAVFGRVLLEMIEEKGVETNYPSTGFFIMAKKNYLYQALNQKSIESPATVAVASEKASRNLENHLELPVLARNFNSLEEAEKSRIETWEEAENFVEGVEYPEEFVLFHQLEQGDKYRALYAGGEIISLQDSSDGWRFKNEKLQYSSMPSEIEERVEKTAKAIGTWCCEVELRGNKVFDVRPNPDLEKYTELSGKDARKAVSKVLKGGKN